MEVSSELVAGLISLLTLSLIVNAWMCGVIRAWQTRSRYQAENIGDWRAKARDLESENDRLKRQLDKEEKLRTAAEKDCGYYANLVDQIRELSRTKETVQAHEDVRTELIESRRATKAALKAFDELV